MSQTSRGRRFYTTRWSLVIAASDPHSSSAETALAELCQAYWYPVYSFIRRSGHCADDARDLTQAFFARVLEKGYLRDARQERGRFRSFLLASVRHFLANERDFRTTLKRGGGALHLSLEFERRYEPADDLTPERLYERQWALHVLEQAMQTLEARYADRKKHVLFDRLKPLLGGDSIPHAELAALLGMTEGALRVAVHRLRQQFGAVLRQTIAETVDAPEEVDSELRYLLDIVKR
jgi:RNA polymerase sigma factor (sigma-70 family)